MPNVTDALPVKAPKDVENLRQKSLAGQTEPHAYASLLGIKSYDTLKLREQVEKGLSYKAFERLQGNIVLSLKRLAELIRIPPRTLARRKEQGRLLPDESDRLLRLSRIFAESLELFEGDFHAARTWLFTPQPALGGGIPIEFSSSEVGAREVENLIGRLEHGIPS